MPICVYDNPTNMRREAWQDGKIIADISMRLMYQKGFNGFRQMFFVLNVGKEFIAGKTYGDSQAIKDNP